MLTRETSFTPSEEAWDWIAESNRGGYDLMPACEPLLGVDPDLLNPRHLPGPLGKARVVDDEVQELAGTRPQSLQKTDRQSRQQRRCVPPRRVEEAGQRRAMATRDGMRSPAHLAAAAHEPRQRQLVKKTMLGA